MDGSNPSAGYHSGDVRESVGAELIRTLRGPRGHRGRPGGTVHLLAVVENGGVVRHQVQHDHGLPSTV